MPVRMYRAGNAYSEMPATLNITENQVSSALRRAHRLGELPAHGVRFTNR